jgi:hypothetical protein
VQNRHTGIGLERYTTTQHLVCENAQRIEISPRIDGLALGLFGSHILGGTGDLANAREERTLTSSGNAEVGQARAMAR